MATSLGAKLTCLVFLFMVAWVPFTQAITCNQVVSYVSPCVPYLTNRAPLAAGCCNGVRSLNSVAQTTMVRRQACVCLKSAASQIQGLNRNLVAGLPTRCGVRFPYAISPAIDCSRIT